MITEASMKANKLHVMHAAKQISKEKDDEEQKKWDGYISAMERRAKELRERDERNKK